MKLTRKKLGILVAFVLLLGFGIIFLFIGTSQLACFGCGTTQTTIISGASCFANSTSCRIVLQSLSSSSGQVVGCFWTTVNGFELGRGTLYTNSTGPQFVVSAANPLTVAGHTTITAYCSDYPGKPTLGARVVPGVQLADGERTSFWGTSEGNTVWK